MTTVRGDDRQIRAAICREQGHTLDDRRHCSVCGVTLPEGFSDAEWADLQARFARLADRARMSPPAPGPDETYTSAVVGQEGTQLPGWCARRTFAQLHALWPVLHETQADALRYVEARSADWVSYRPALGVLLCGPVGAGKTSIAAAAAVRCDEPRGCRWRNADSFFAALKAEMDDRSPRRALDRALSARLLFLDGIFPAGRATSDWEVRVVQDVIERRHNHRGGGALIVTTNAPAESYRHPTTGQVVAGLDRLLGESVWSRLVSMVDIVPVVGPDHRRTNSATSSHEQGA